jgi:hypothetical protein
MISCPRSRRTRAKGAVGKKWPLPPVKLNRTRTPPSSQAVAVGHLGGAGDTAGAGDPSARGRQGLGLSDGTGLPAPPRRGRPLRVRSWTHRSSPHAEHHAITTTRFDGTTRQNGISGATGTGGYRAPVRGASGGAGADNKPERPALTVEQVYAIAGAIVPRYRAWCCWLRSPGCAWASCGPCAGSASTWMPLRSPSPPRMATCSGDRSGGGALHPAQEPGRRPDRRCARAGYRGDEGSLRPRGRSRPRRSGLPSRQEH